MPAGRRSWPRPNRSNEKALRRGDVRPSSAAPWPLVGRRVIDLVAPGQYAIRLVAVLQDENDCLRPNAPSVVEVDTHLDARRLAALDGRLRLGRTEQLQERL